MLESMVMMAEQIQQGWRETLSIDLRTDHRRTGLKIICRSLDEQKKCHYLSQLSRISFSLYCSRCFPLDLNVAIRPRRFLSVNGQTTGNFRSRKGMIFKLSVMLFVLTVMTQQKKVQELGPQQSQRRLRRVVIKAEFRERERCQEVPGIHVVEKKNIYTVDINMVMQSETSVGSSLLTEQNHHDYKHCQSFSINTASCT